MIPFLMGVFAGVLVMLIPLLVTRGRYLDLCNTVDDAIVKLSEGE